MSSNKILGALFTIKIVSGAQDKHCDLYCHGSYHQVRKDEEGHHWVEGRIDTIRDQFAMKIVDKIPDETKCCVNCENTFDKDWPFIGDGCIRCYERMNFVNREEYRNAVRKELEIEMNSTKTN